MINQTIDDALKCVDAYQINKRQDKYKLVAMTERIAREQGKNEAMTRLNNHLDRHYKLQNNHQMEFYIS